MILHAALYLLGLAVLVPLLTLLVELAASLTYRRRLLPADDDSPFRTVVLIPAHNESAGIRSTLESLIPQLDRHTRILVVADNCTDDTARLAGEYPVEVIERQDPGRRGKAWALAFGAEYLAREEPPDVVIVIDADCTVGPQAVRRLTQQAVRTGGPVQAAYYLTSPAQPDAGQLLSTTAFTFKNVIRPQGLEALGLPCVLTGSGMAFPWDVMASHPQKTGRAGEDLMLTVALAKAGHFATFCRNAVITSPGFSDKRMARQQRRLWEQTHLDTLIRQVPALLIEGVRKRRVRPIALAMEINVPPLSLLALSWFPVSVSAALLGHWTLLGALSGAMLLCTLAALWILPSIPHVRFTLPLLLSLPGYIARKIPYYVRFLFGPDLDWSSRSNPTNSPSPRCPPEARRIRLPPALPSPGSPPEIRLMDVRIHAVSEAQCVGLATHRMSQSRGGRIETVDIGTLREILRNPILRTSFEQADLVVPDGMPLLWASRLKGTPLRERISGTGLIWSFSAAVASAGKSVYFLGGRSVTVERTASILKTCFPALKVAGHYASPSDSYEEAEVIEDMAVRLIKALPHIVFTALDVNRSEAVIARVREELQSMWWLGVGAGFCYISGERIRAPHWMRITGLEGLYDIMQEPSTATMRSLLSGIPFTLRLFGRALRER